MWATTAVICIVILIWSLIDAEAAPGLTKFRPFGVTALLGLGGAILLSGSPSPYLIASESFFVSLVFLVLINALMAMGLGDYPTKTNKVIHRIIVVVLLPVTCWTALFLGGLPALYGAIAAIIVAGGLTSYALIVR